MSLRDHLVDRIKHAASVQRLVQRVKTAGYDDKFVGKDARLQWSRGQWLLEELPQKGKKKLRSATLQNPNGIGGSLDWFLPGNILMFANLSTSDDYLKIKGKIEDAYKEAIQRTEKDTSRGGDVYLQRNDWVYKIKWYEDEVFYLNVIPEGVEKFTAEGKDFEMSVAWTAFKAYSPNSDFQQSDPHYTYYEQKSPTAARKLYLILKTDPNQLKSVAWSQLGDWLNRQKVPYDTQFSSWS
jgi:hypothetical protein